MLIPGTTFSDTPVDKVRDEIEKLFEKIKKHNAPEVMSKLVAMQAFDHLEEMSKNKETKKQAIYQLNAALEYGMSKLKKGKK